MFDQKTPAELELQHRLTLQEMKCFRDVRHAGDSSVDQDTYDFVFNHLGEFDNTPSKLKTVSSASPFEAFKNIPENCDSDDQTIWKKWRECTIKSELQHSFITASEAGISSLRERYDVLQGNDSIPALLKIAFSNIGSYSEWREQDYEESDFLNNLGRVGGVANELNDTHIYECLARAKGEGEMSKQRRKLLRRVLHCPVQTLPVLYNFDLLMRKEALFKYHQPVFAYLNIFGEDISTVATKAAEEELKTLLAGDDRKLLLLGRMRERCVEVAREERIRLNALYALLPQLSLLSLAQAKWFVYATIHSDHDSDDKDCLDIQLPPVVFEALICLFQEKSFLYNDDIESSIRSIAAHRLGNAAQECPGPYWAPVLAAFNSALVIVAEKIPGRADSYAFMNRIEMATLLDIICDMQAVGCIRKVRNMYAKTAGRMVNHSYSRFSGASRLGLLDFLMSMGVEDVREKDVRVSAGRPQIQLNGKEFNNFMGNSSSITAKVEQYSKKVQNKAQGMASDNCGSGISSRSVSCAACGAVEVSDMKMCSQCKMTSYCSRACQKQHWSVHKKTCVKV
jgi:hypothetical protein